MALEEAKAGSMYAKFRNNNALKNDWERIAAYKLKIIHFGHANEQKLTD